MLKTKTRTILLSLLTIFILTVFIFLFFVILKNPSLSESSVSSVFLVNVITITLIFLLLLVLVVKSIIRLIYQRRQNILGSRLNAKLVFIMLLLVLIPTVPTYFIIGPIINNIFNVWNQKRIRDAVDSSIGISRSYLQNEEKYLKISLSNFIDKTKLNIKMKSLTSSDKVNLENRIKEDGYKEVYIFDLHRKEVFRYPAESQKEFTDKELASVFEDINSLPQTEINIERDILDCYYPVFYKENFRGILIVSKELDTDALLQIKKIEETAREYNSLIKFGRRSYSFIINLSFLAISLVLLFLTFWISFYIAKQITIPVEALLIGTEKVAQGDLDVHIDVQTSDELGNLVDSFNKMVKDIHDLNIKNEEYTKFISSILQNINAGVIALSKEKKIVEINQAAKDLLHLDSGRDLDCFKDLFEDEGNFTLADSLLEECLKSKKEVCHQEVIMNINGKSFNFHMSITLGIESLHGGFLIVFDDITHIIHIQKIEVWRDVATQLAHEIKNPLTPIKLSAQRVLKKYNEGADDFGEILNRSYSTIIQEVDNIKALVDHFNSFARLPEPKLQELNLNEIITEVSDLYRTQENLKIIEEYSDNLPPLLLDKMQIKRAMKNIIDNAIESFLKKGTIKISTEFFSDGNFVLLQVQDDGKGMEKEELEKIFLPYFSSKEKGMGLGLAIVDKIISDHNAQIEIFSEPYQGTTVKIKFFAPT